MAKKNEEVSNALGMFVSGLDETTIENVVNEAPAPEYKEMESDTEEDFGDSVLSSLPIKKKEKRDRRVQLLMKPSLHRKVTALSEEYGMSFNDFVHQILEQVTSEQ